MLLFVSLESNTLIPWCLTKRQDPPQNGGSIPATSYSAGLSSYHK